MEGAETEREREDGMENRDEGGGLRSRGEENEEAENRGRKKRQQMRSRRALRRQGADRWLLWRWRCGTTLYFERATDRQTEREI